MFSMRINWIRIFAILQFAVNVLLIYRVFSHSRIEGISPIQDEVTNSRKNRLELISNYDESTLTKLENLIARKADGRDLELIELVREIMDPPPVYHSIKLSRGLAKTPQAEVVDSYLKNMTSGFFVEVGGLDGERSSNSLYFEMKRKWTGLLIEADPLFYTQLLGKNRRCWSINACLSPTSYVSKFKFEGSSVGTGRLAVGKKDDQKPNDVDKKLSLFSAELIVPCFPLETLLLALNRTIVDFFSLDVEGVELDILQSLDFQRLYIKTLAVEYTHGNKSAYIPFMESKGFELVKEIIVANNIAFANDYIFGKK